jgi:hypothetical protein
LKRGLFLFLGVSLVSSSCRCTPTHESAPDAAPPPELPSVGPLGPLPVRSSRLAMPAADTPCEGASLSLVALLFDARCAVSERDWKGLVSAPRDGGALPRQEARRDGDHVVLSLVNRGAEPITLPMQAIFGRPDLAPFSVYAEDDKHAAYELAPPSAGEVADTDLRHVHRARIVLPPGGEASVTLTIDPTVAGRIAPECSDAAPCTERRLPPGHYTLYVGQRLVPEAGPPAKVAWEVTD